MPPKKRKRRPWANYNLKGKRPPEIKPGTWNSWKQRAKREAAGLPQSDHKERDREQSREAEQLATVTAIAMPPTHPSHQQGKAELVKRSQSNGFVAKYSPQVCDAIAANIRKGMPMTFAAYKVRVSAQTVNNWLDQGEENPEGPFGKFAADVREAQARFVEEAIDGIKDSGFSDAKQWTALMTLLERIYPDYFKRPEKTTNINIGIGLEARLHEMHEQGEIVYEGG